MWLPESVVLQRHRQKETNAIIPWDSPEEHWKETPDREQLVKYYWVLVLPRLTGIIL